MIPRELELDHHLAVMLRLWPRRRQSLQQGWLPDHEKAVALYLLEPDLGRVLPLGCTRRDALGLLGKRPLRQLLRFAHRSTNSSFIRCWQLWRPHDSYLPIRILRRAFAPMLIL